jgi:hypothetical protein
MGILEWCERIDDSLGLERAAFFTFEHEMRIGLVL